MERPTATPEQKALALTNLQAAVARLVVSHGFFAGALLRKRMYAKEDLPMPTIGTDGRDLYYDPAFVAAQNVPDLMALLVHEACHDLGLHSFRRGKRDELLTDPEGTHVVSAWNVACDHVVNEVVKECGLHLPAGGVEPIADTTPEALYEDIVKKAKKNGKKRGEGKCDCNVMTPKGANGEELSGAAKAEAEAEAKLTAAMTAELARRAGKLPAGLARLVGAALEERVPWPQIVSRFVTASSHMESAWRKPNRRYLTRGIVLPSLWSPDVPDFVLACDTSGSIDTRTLEKICGEVLHALSTCERRGQTQLTVVWCDTEISVQEDIQTEKDLRPQGGGGTMFSPVFTWVNEHKPLTKGVVYVTDGYCADFGETPEYPVLWVLTAPNESFQPPFGEISCVMDG